MNTKSLAIVLDGIAPIVRDFVVKQLDGVSARLKALEERAPVAGPAGPPGPAGERGEKGEAGERGADGEAGPQGVTGEKGEAGPAGERGITGEKGLDGEAGPRGEAGERGPAGEAGAAGITGEKGLDGAPGRDGRDGMPGVQGEKGIDGLHGKDGRDGIDGLGFDDLDVIYDGERTFTFKFVQGDREKAFTFKAPFPIYRGTLQHGKAYDRGDCVTYAGSMWTALSETKNALPGTDAATGLWQLATKKGTDGKVGPQGPRGEFVTVKAK